jgi:hypothetical protein
MCLVYKQIVECTGKTFFAKQLKSIMGVVLIGGVGVSRGPKPIMR